MEATTSGAIYANLALPLLPLWGVALALVVVLPLSTLLGYLLGRSTYFKRGYDKSPPASLPGETSLPAILALLGLLLAFTYGFAINWAGERKIAVTDEAADLGTAFLRADFVAEPGRSELQEAILAYARTRYVPAGIVYSAAELNAVIQRTLTAQAKLWPAVLRATSGDTPPPIQVFVANGVTAVLDAHTRRIASESEPVPLVAKLLMLSAAAGALFLQGNNTALRGRALTWRTFVFAALLTAVMYVIHDIERPGHGMVLLNNDSLLAGC
jgi:hypothetical protein